MDTVIDPEWRDLKAIRRDILVVLALEGPANGVELDTKIGTGNETANTTQRNVQILADKGYLTHEQNPDNKREWVNSLTPKGERVVRRGLVDMADQVREGEGDE